MKQYEHGFWSASDDYVSSDQQLAQDPWVSRTDIRGPGYQYGALGKIIRLVGHREGNKIVTAYYDGMAKFIALSLSLSLSLCCSL